MNTPLSGWKNPFLTKIKFFISRLFLKAMPYFPLPKELFRKFMVKDSDRRYSSGRWNYLKGIEESHRYSLISGCDYFKSKDKKILDVGCGEGI